VTTSEPAPVFSRIINSGWTTAGTLAAVPLAGAAVATGAWGWAVGAVGAAGIAVCAAAAATWPGKKPRSRPHSPSRQRWLLRTYFFLSPTRIAMLHAQIYGGEAGQRLIEVMARAQGGLKVGLDVPPVSVIGEGVREEATKYQQELTHTLTTMAADVLSHLETDGLIHGMDADLDEFAHLVEDDEADDQFLQFKVPARSLHEFVMDIPAPPADGPDNTGKMTFHTGGLDITVHIGTRGREREDFGELANLERTVRLVGVIRDIDPESCTATVRVIAVY
jgi:hypothetical protein